MYPWLSCDRLARRLLVAVIRLYRRRLSGRGPFARLRCTFERCESCSAFGERIALEARSLSEALARIARRLWRCRHLSLYRLAGGGLCGGQGYDRWFPIKEGTEAGIRAELEARGEREPARAAIVAAAAELGGQPAGRPAPGPALLVRDQAAVTAALVKRWRSRALATASAWGLAATLLAFGLGVAALPCAGVGLAAAGSAWSARRLHRRLERLAVLEGLELAATGGRS